MSETDDDPETLAINVERLTEDVRSRLGREDGTVAVLALRREGVKVYVAEGAEVSVTDVPLSERKQVLCVRSFFSFVDTNNHLRFCVPPYYFDTGPFTPE